MNKVLINILEEFTINSAPTISKAIEPLKKHFNIDVFYHVYVNSEGDYWWAGSHAECSQYVAEKQLCLHAPHIIHPSQIVTSYLCPEKLTHIPYYKQLVDTHIKILNAKNLFMFVKKYQDYYELYTFGSTHEKNDCESFYNSPALQQHFINYFLGNTDRLRTKARSQSFNLADNQAKYFQHSEASPVYHIQANNFKQFWQDVSMKRGHQFTAREVDCIKALISGKTANGTAKELDISARTVETHINNIRNKLGVKYKSEIVTKIISDKNYATIIADE